MNKKTILPLILIFFLVLTPSILAKRPHWTQCIHKNKITTCKEQWEPFSEYIQYSTNYKSIKFSWENNWVEITPKFISKKGIINSFLNLANGLTNIDQKIKQVGDSYKFGWNITNIIAPNSVENIILEIKTSDDSLIEWVKNGFYYKNTFFNFQDIVENGNNITIDTEKKIIIIQNTSGLKNFYIDPTTEVISDGSIFGYDTVYKGNRVSEYNPSTAFNDNYLSIASNNDGKRAYSYLMINLSNIDPNLNPLDIKEMYLDLEFYQETNSWNAINVTFYYCADTYNKSTLTWNNKDTEVTNCDTEPFLEWEIPYANNGDIFSFNITPAIKQHPNQKQFTIMMKPNPEQYDNLQTGVDFYNSGSLPRLNITYYSINITTTPINPYYKQNFSFKVEIENGYPTNITQCNETIIDSEGNTIYQNHTMTNNGDQTFTGGTITANKTYYNSTITCTNTEGDTTTKKYQLYTYYYNYSIIYDSEVVSTAEATHQIIIDTAPTIYLQNALLEYDGTNYTTSILTNNNQYTATKTINTPLVNSDENKTFRWYVFFNEKNETTEQKNQIIRTFGVTNCSTGGNKTLIFYIRNESDNSLVTGTAENEFKVWYKDPELYKTINWKETGINNYDVCIYPSIDNLTADYTIKYYATNFQTRIKQEKNTILTTTTQTKNLYLGTGQDTINIHVSDQNDDAIQNAIVKIFLKDLSTGEFKEIESIATDNSGIAQATLTTQNNLFKFEILYNGKSIYNSSETKITSTDLYFQIDLTKYTDLEDYLNILRITHQLIYDNTTNQFILSYDDPNNYAQEVCLEVEQKNETNSTKIGLKCSEETTNTLQINIGSNKEGLYIATAYVIATIDNNKYLIDSISEDFTSSWKIFGETGVLLAILLIGTVSLIILSNPSSTIILSLLSISIASLLGLIHISWIGLLGIIVVGVIIILKNRT